MATYEQKQVINRIRSIAVSGHMSEAVREGQECIIYDCQVRVNSYHQTVIVWILRDGTYKAFCHASSADVKAQVEKIVEDALKA